MSDNFLILYISVMCAGFALGLCYLIYSYLKYRKQPKETIVIKRAVIRLEGEGATVVEVDELAPAEEAPPCGEAALSPEPQQTEPFREPEAEAAATVAVPEEGKIIVVEPEPGTLKERYARLSPQGKEYFDALAEYAAGFAGVRRFSGKAAETFSLGREQLARLSLRRDTVLVRVVIPNEQFKRYLDDNGIKGIRDKPLDIKVIDGFDLKLAMDAIAINYKRIQSERAERAKRKVTQKEEQAGEERQ